jgi:hypothetical protein
MSKFSDEQREAILSKGRANTPQPQEPTADVEHQPEQDDRALTLEEALTFDDANKMAFDTMIVKSAKHEVVYKTTVTPSQQPPSVPIDIGTLIDEKIRTNPYLSEALRAVSEVFDKLAEDKDDRADELRQLRIEVSNLEMALGELRQILAADRARTIDLPNPITPRRMQ